MDTSVLGALPHLCVVRHRHEHMALLLRHDGTVMAVKQAWLLIVWLLSSGADTHM